MHYCLYLYLRKKHQARYLLYLQAFLSRKLIFKFMDPDPKNKKNAAEYEDGFYVFFQILWNSKKIEARRRSLRGGGVYHEGSMPKWYTEKRKYEINKDYKDG